MVAAKGGEDLCNPSLITFFEWCFDKNSATNIALDMLNIKEPCFTNIEMYTLPGLLYCRDILKTSGLCRW